MGRGIDDHFMRAAAAHLTEESPLLLAMKILLDAQSGEFIGRDADFPSWRIRQTAIANRKHFRRR
jgi:hypothetical protein